MTHSPPDTVCPEKRLLIYCARVSMQPAMASSIRHLVSNPVDWDYLLSKADENSLIPLLYSQLNSVAADQISAARMERLKTAARANAAHSLLLTAELIKIMGALGSRAIPAIPCKGPVLAAQAYGDISLRQFEDLDVIVRQTDLAKAHEVMLGLGYRAKFPLMFVSDVASLLVPGEYIYTHEARQTMVELHTERSMRHFPAQPNLDVLMQKLVSVSLSGHEIETFAAEDALPILCIHGSKHFWGKLSWIVDISEMIESHPDLDWNEAWRWSESFRAERMLAVGLALAANLLGAPLPEAIDSRVRNDRIAVEVAAEVERRLLCRELPPLRAWERLSFRRRMLSGTMGGWRYALRLATSPAEEDWEMVRLPGPLAPLYVALRPIRLLLKYGRRRRDESPQ